MSSVSLAARGQLYLASTRGAAVRILSRTASSNSSRSSARVVPATSSRET
jgi:hypothetical protein